MDKNDKPLLIQLKWTGDDKGRNFFFRCDEARNKPSKSKPISISKQNNTFGKPTSSGSDIPGYDKPAENVFSGNHELSISGEIVPRLSHKEVIVYVCPKFLQVITSKVSISRFDTADRVIKNALGNSHLMELDPRSFCLVLVTRPVSTTTSVQQLNRDYKEHHFREEEHPLLLYTDSIMNRSGLVQFEVRKKNYGEICSSKRSRLSTPKEPAELVEISDGMESHPKKFILTTVTEIGSDAALLDTGSIHLTSRGIMPRHCTIMNIDSEFYISPLHKLALIYVNKQLIKETTYIPHRAKIQLGECSLFRFLLPLKKKSSTSMYNLRTTTDLCVGSVHEQKLFDPPLTLEYGLSKAFSVNNLCTSNIEVKSIDRTYSGHNLKVYGNKHNKYGIGQDFSESIDTHVETIPNMKVTIIILND